MRKAPVIICPCQNIAVTDNIHAIKRAIISPPASTLVSLGLDRNAYESLLPSAIASLTGTHRADQQAPRERFVREVLEGMRSSGLITSFSDNTHESGRFDFSVTTRSSRKVTLDAKGGEGNSITISSRPLDCHEFGIWSHLTGSLAKAPGVQAQKVASRMLKVMLNREEDSKRYDFLIVWDSFCGSAVRPCPMAGARVFPCVILFPQVQATKTSLHPPLHDLTTTELPALLFDHLELNDSERIEHVWQCDIELFNEGTNWYRNVRFIRMKDGSVQEISRKPCNPDDAPKSTP